MKAYRKAILTGAVKPKPKTRYTDVKCAVCGCLLTETELFYGRLCTKDRLNPKNFLK